MQPRTQNVSGQPSYKIASSTVEAYLTHQGGHLGPVTFNLGGKKISPYAVAPWASEKLPPATPPIIKVLRGDFFCLPFGANAQPFRYQGRRENHPLHGETANAPWHLEEFDRAAPVTGIHLSLKTKARPGRVDKILTLVDGDHALYSRHILSGMSGPMTLGHHAMLQFPQHPDNLPTGLIATSPNRFAQVYVHPVENPADKGYSLLKPGAIFKSLHKVPTITGQYTDLSQYPARRGFEDIAILVSKPNLPFAWTAVTFPQQRYVWFALKDPRVLHSTLLWFSNGGRHYAPWNGSHVNVMGLEEITGYFHEGLAASAAPNPLSQRGIPTVVHLDPQRPLMVNYIQAVAAIPAGFDHVASIIPDAPQSLLLTSVSGQQTRASVDWSFLHGTMEY